MFDLSPTALPGCLEIAPRLLDDERGRFVKVFHAQAFADAGLATDFKEEYYSRSNRGVVRGLHFQTPPAAHVKMVYCTHGEVFDVVLDLRVGSPTFGQAASFTLSADKGNVLYIPKGLAHGFCALSPSATLVYKVTTVYDPLQDQGVLWSSAPVQWPLREPLVSKRDAGLIALSEFASPFVYGAD